MEEQLLQPRPQPQRLTFGGTISRVFFLWKNHFGLFATIVAVTSFAVAPIFGFFTAAPLLLSLQGVENESQALAVQLGSFGAAYGFTQSYAGSIVHVVLSAGAAKIYLEQHATVIGCFKDAWSNMYAIIGSTIVVWLIRQVVGIVVGIIGLSVSMALLVVSMANPNSESLLASMATFALSFASLAMEPILGLTLTNASIFAEGITSPMNAVGRSWKLTSGSRWYIVRMHSCLWAVHYLGYATAGAILYGCRGTVLGSFVELLMQLLPIMCFSPLSAILNTALYWNLRTERK